MLSKESYEAVKAQADEEGLEFWAFIAKATTYYLRKKKGSKVKLEAISRDQEIAQRLEKWKKIELAIMEELFDIRPKGLTVPKILEQLKLWDINISRTALNSRLMNLGSQGVIEKQKVGNMFGKVIYSWFTTPDDNLVNKWYKENL